LGVVLGVGPGSSYSAQKPTPGKLARKPNVKKTDINLLTPDVRPSYKDDEPNKSMILKTEIQQKAFNHIANFLGIKPNGPGSFFLAAWIMSYSESNLKNIPVSQIGHAAGWNARKLVSYMKEFPNQSYTPMRLDYSETEISDVSKFLAAYEKTFGRPISGQV
jgi:hypothetical protein